MLISATSPLVLYMYNFVLDLFLFIIINISYLTVMVEANLITYICASGWFVLPVGLYFRLVCTSGWFVLPVGLYERKVTTARPTGNTYMY